MTAAVLLVTGLVPLPQRDSFRNSFDDGPPFSSVLELPYANEADRAAMMELAAAFLESPQWSGESAAAEDWDLADVAALTRRGERIGVYADVQFERRWRFSGPVQFIRCGQNETWVSPDGEFEIGGLNIWLLDGESQPYNVLPLNRRGELPKLQDVELFVETPVDCTGPVRVNAPAPGEVPAVHNYSPVFARPGYAFKVFEDAGAGRYVGTVSATDPNTGDAVSYSIIRDSSDGKFSIDAGTGRITVAEALDSRTASSYTLTAHASDLSGASATTTVTIKLTADLVDRYDVNSDGLIDRDEAETAADDYSAGYITGDEMMSIVSLHFLSPTPDSEGQKLREDVSETPPTAKPVE